MSDKKDAASVNDMANQISLVKALTEEDFETAVNALMNNRCFINITNEFGSTPLSICCDKAYEHVCMYSKSLDVMKLLLMHENCDVNVKNEFGYNALMYACLYDLPEYAKLLLSDSRCNPFEQDKKGNTPLILCCRRAGEDPSCIDKYICIIKLLLKHEACGMCICNDEGYNALMYACHYAMPELANLLLNDSRCDPCQQDKLGYTPLIISCGMVNTNPFKLDKYLQIIQMLLKHTECSIGICDNKGNTALSYACNLALPECAELLLDDERCDPCHQNKDGCTPLILCCGYAAQKPSKLDKYMQIIKMLLKRDHCGINICDKSNKNALSYACKSAMPECVKLIISDKKCNLCQHDENGYTPLIRCCAYASEDVANFDNYINIIQILLTRDDCGINMCDNVGMNVLMHACANPLFSCVKVLLSHKLIDLCACDVYGGTCLHHLLRSLRVGRVEPILNMLIKHTQFTVCAATLDNRGFSALDILLRNSRFFHPEMKMCNGGLQIITTLLSFGNLFTTSQRSIALAAKHAGIDICRELIVAGFNIQSILPQDETLLHCILKNNSLPKFNLLLRSWTDMATFLNVRWQCMSPVEMALSHECHQDMLQKVCQHLTWKDVKYIIMNVKPINQTFEHFVKSLKVSAWTKHVTQDTHLADSCDTQISVTTDSDRFTITEKDTNSTIFKGVHSCSSSKSIFLVKHCQYLRKKYKSHFICVTKCALIIVQHISDELRKTDEWAFMAFEPLLSGSMKENTKAFYPNEVDIVCKFIKEEGLRFINGEHFVSVSVAEDSSWINCSDMRNNLHDSKVLRGFYQGMSKVLQSGLVNRLAIEMPFIYIGQYPLRYEDKIPRLVFCYNKPPFNNMQVSVDLAPAFESPDYTMEKPLPMQAPCSEYLALVKCSRQSNERVVALPITYSSGEHNIMLNLPEYIRDGYVTATAVRLASICEPNLNAKQLGILEPIDIQSFISSYILKCCLYRLLIQIKNGEKQEPDSCKFAWADEIYKELKESLQRWRVILTWYDNSLPLLNCSDHSNYDFACCQKRRLMLTFIRKIRAWLSEHLYALRYQRRRRRSAYKFAMITEVLNKI